MFQVVYLSTATREYGKDELKRILEVSRRNNEADGVTGMLCYHDGTFFQMLEGDREKVQQVMERVEKDNRHFGVTVLLEDEVEERTMKDWSMAFRELSAPEASALTGFDHALKASGSSRLSDEELKGEALGLLKSFADSSRPRLGAFPA